MIEITEKDLELLNRVREMMPDHSTTRSVPAIYVTPAGALRQAADRIEYEEKTAKEFDDLIKRLTNK